MYKVERKFPYPPCIMSPNTESPYARHEWEIGKGKVFSKKNENGEDVYYYKILCKRCQLNDPKPSYH